MPTKITNARLSFPALFVPERFKPSDEPKFKATFLIEKNSADARLIEEAIRALAKQSWGAKADNILRSIRSNPNKFCWQDGDTKSYDGYAGMMALSAKAKARPVVVDRDKTPLVQEDGRPYPGCYVDASVEFFTYDSQGSGISASLRWVQFRADGDAFSGSKPVDQDEFADLAAGADSDDPLAD